MAIAVRECVCGHSRDVHQHYRPGSDCSRCASGHCTRFRPAMLRKLRSERLIAVFAAAYLRHRRNGTPCGPM